VYPFGAEVGNVHVVAVQPVSVTLLELDVHAVVAMVPE